MKKGAALSFEEIVSQLNSKGIKITSLAQIEDGWTVSLRTKNNFSAPYGSGKTIQDAVALALANLKSQMSEKDWAAIVEKQNANKPKKRQRLRAKRE